jgi:hypothetical protein
MACIAVFSPMAMATTQLARVIRYESDAPWIVQKTPEQRPLRMNWVVVTDKDGKRRLSTEWLPVAGS